MTTVRKILSIALVNAIETLLILGIVFDLVWYEGLELKQFNNMARIGLSLAYVSTLIIFVASYTKSGEVRIDFKKPRQLNTLLLVLVIIGLLLVVSNVREVKDLNDVYHIERNNSESVYLMGNEIWVYLLGGVSNVTSDQEPYVSVWVDLQYFDNATVVFLTYYNGTSKSEGANKTTSFGTPNTQWWTGYWYSWFYTEEGTFENPFGNSSAKNILSYRIPKQKANTTVEYAFFIGTRNGTDISFIFRESNYTVLYSQYENEQNSLLIERSYFFTGLSLVLIALNYKLYESSKMEEANDFSSEREFAEAAGIIKKEPESQSVTANTLNDKKYPTTQEMVQRSDRLDDLRSNHRTASGGFVALAVGFLLYLQGERLLASTLFLMSFGVSLAILCNLYSLVVSLGEVEVKQGDRSVTYDLLPVDNNENEFRFHLFLRIQKQLTLITRMRQSMQIGVLVIICGLIGDFAIRFLMPWDIMTFSLLSQTIFGVCVGSMVISVLLATWWVIKQMGVTYRLPE